MTLQLARELRARGHRVDLVLAQATGPLASEVPAGVEVVNLAAPRVLRAIPGLARYLRSARPRVLMSRMFHANFAAIVAARLARTSTPTIVVEASHLSAQIDRGKLSFFHRHLLARAYRQADAVVGVSRGVSQDLIDVLRLPPPHVHTIYNPVVEPSLAARAAQSPSHIWFADRSTPVFVAVGRLSAEKDYATLLRAFARLRKGRAARLVILGEGPERARLEHLARELELQSCVALPGFCRNPHAAMKRAAGFVLSSRYEGLPNALVEALACGCPAAATDCPSGPNEILANGRWGELVPVGDDAALAAAMARLLDSPPDRERLRLRGAEFSASDAVDAYVALIEHCEYRRSLTRKAA